MKHLSIFIICIILFACNAKQVVVEKSVVQSYLPRISDSIAFGPYVLDLIEQGKFINSDCIDTRNPIFLQDSIYKEAQKYPWFLLV